MRDGRPPGQKFHAFIKKWKTVWGLFIPDFTQQIHVRGVGDMSKGLNVNVGIDKIKDNLLSRIDKKDPLEVEKVGRYLKHIEMYRKMERTVKKEGVSVITENGSQSFLKSHPLLGEMNKVNSAIINIERSFNFKDEGERGYTSSDLV